MKMGRFLALREHFKNEAALPNVIFPVSLLVLLIITANISTCISELSFAAHLPVLLPRQRFPRREMRQSPAACQSRLLPSDWDRAQ